MNEKAEEMYEFVTDYMSDNNIESIDDLDKTDFVTIAREVVMIASRED